VVIRQRVSGVWKPARAIRTPYASSPYGVSVVLQDPNRIRVSLTDGEYGSDFSYVYSAESPDGGNVWFAWENVGFVGQYGYRNDWPSVIWPSAGTRYVLWNGWSPNTTNYRLYIRRGLGTPVGPWQLATPWVAVPVSAPPRAYDGFQPTVRSPKPSSAINGASTR
jgi:hypothetical protein